MVTWHPFAFRGVVKVVEANEPGPWVLVRHRDSPRSARGSRAAWTRENTEGELCSGLTRELQSQYCRIQITNSDICDLVRFTPMT